jgi:hypothetical protein
MDIDVNPDGDIHAGYLKDDIKVKTPYGDMIAAAAGRLTGFFHDFAFYKNGNICMMWPKKRVKIRIDGMEIIIPAYNEGEVALGIGFHENFMLSSCQTANQATITATGVHIPPWSYLYFSNDGKLESFVTRGRWTFMDVEYPAFHRYDVIDNKIIPKKAE